MSSPVAPPAHIPMFPVPRDSSKIAEMGYDEASRTQQVKYKGSGVVWRYFEVPKSVHEACLAADSIGSYHHWNVIKVYRGEKFA